MLDGGLCMECLGTQYYNLASQTCKDCDETCKSCSGSGRYSCLTCVYPLHLDRLNSQCVPCCPNNTVPENQSCCVCEKDTGIVLFFFELLWVHHWIKLTLLFSLKGGCISSSTTGKRRISDDNRSLESQDTNNLKSNHFSVKTVNPYIITTSISIIALLAVLGVILLLSYRVNFFYK